MCPGVSVDEPFVDIVAKTVTKATFYGDENARPSEHHPPPFWLNVDVVVKNVTKASLPW